MSYQYHALDALGVGERARGRAVYTDELVMHDAIDETLVGRIPTTAEVDEYVKSKDADKRAKLVDRLIASPAFARHQAALFEAMFNPDGERRGGSGALRAAHGLLMGAVRGTRPSVRRRLPPLQGKATQRRPARVSSCAIH